MAKWTKYSYGALAFCGVLSTYIGIVEYRHAMHPHEHEDIAYPHEDRAKPTPGTARLRVQLSAATASRGAMSRSCYHPVFTHSGH